jgi:hypothetical protein
VRLRAGFAASWAGPHPFRPGLCFGSEDGQVLFTDEQGNEIVSPDILNPFLGAVSAEAVTGVVCVGTWVVVSSRDDISFWPLPGSEGGHERGFSHSHGAHNISSTRSGFLVASLGRAGILAAKPPFSRGIGLTSGQEKDFYAYRTIGVGTADNVELLACASRAGGVATVEFSGTERTHKVQLATFAGLDVVDVCTLQAEEESRAIAALDRAGNLILSKDVLGDRKPTIIRYDAVEGIAYRILSCRGDIYLLTSKALYVLAHLAEQFIAGEAVERSTAPFLNLPMEAVDINLCGDGRILAVMPGQEHRLYDASLIHDGAPLREQQPTTLRIVGKWGEVQMSAEQDLVLQSA